MAIATAIGLVAGGHLTTRRTAADEPKNPLPQLPPAAKGPIDFRRDVGPILSRSCVRCHGGAEPQGGLRLESAETLANGGDSGPAVKAGKSAESLLIQLVAGQDPDRVMPAQGKRLSQRQVGILRAWIDAGARWDPQVKLRGPGQASLAPRQPDLPPARPAAGINHPVDRLLDRYFQQRGVGWQPPVGDRVFVRRVYLDLLGLLPPPARVEAFVADQRQDKRERLVVELLGKRAAYAQHWLTFWNDALRNAYRGTGYIDGGRKQITGWLYQSLLDNKPYDRFVHELISPVNGSEGFINGIIWRGVVNASQRREMQAAQNVSQVFLGTNLKCASCHDSFINHWKLADSYGLAAVFADGPLAEHRCNKPTGRTAAVRFIYPQLGSIDAKASRTERMRQLADIVTDRRNGRLSRTIVNRLWGWLQGRAIVEPQDDMDQEPFDADLLDWLAWDLQQHDYDLKHTLARICTSRAYQLPAVGAPRPDDPDFTFRGPLVKRMTAEQFVDAVSTVTEQWPQKAAAPVATPATTKQNQALLLPARWIWNSPQALRGVRGGPIYLRKTFMLDAAPHAAVAVVSGDNSFTLYVNGRRAATGNDWTKPVRIDLGRRLRKGVNTLAVRAANFPDRETEQGGDIPDSANPAGFVLAGALRLGPKQPWVGLVTDKSWLVAESPAAGWERPRFDTKGWKHATELGPAAIAPWRLSPRLSQLLAAGMNPHTAGRFRAALLNDDPLTRALGRPNREQIVTRRDTLATTLQALELTNGETLDATLGRAAAALLQRQSDRAKLVQSVYRKALSRPPHPTEQQAALELLETETPIEGVADLLWVVLMLPEFQLIH